MSLATIARASLPPARSRSREGDEPSPAAAKPDGFEMLTRYIPTETITLYVAAMATRQQVAEATQLSTADAVWRIYWSGAVLTPVVLALLLAVKRRHANLPIAIAYTAWPLFAAFAAYLVWGLSVPGHPVADRLAGLPALGGLLLSTFLSLLDPLFAPRPATTQA